jgi:Cu-processing system permease protein
MTAMLLLVLALRGFRPAGTLLLAVLLVYAELALITAFALLFSTFSTPMLSALFTIAIYFTGHVTEGLMLLKARLQAPASRLLCDVLYYLLPNLENFDLKHQAVHGLPLGEGRVLLALVYGLLYSGAVFFLAVAVFRRRDLP